MPRSMSTGPGAFGVPCDFDRRRRRAARGSAPAGSPAPGSVRPCASCASARRRGPDSRRMRQPGGHAQRRAAPAPRPASDRAQAERALRSVSGRPATMRRSVSGTLADRASAALDRRWSPRSSDRVVALAQRQVAAVVELRRLDRVGRQAQRQADVGDTDQAVARPCRCGEHQRADRRPWRPAPPAHRPPAPLRPRPGGRIHPAAIRHIRRPGPAAAPSPTPGAANPRPGACRRRRGRRRRARTAPAATLQHVLQALGLQLQRVLRAGHGEVTRGPQRLARGWRRAPAASRSTPATGASSTQAAAISGSAARSCAAGSRRPRLDSSVIAYPLQRTPVWPKPPLPRSLCSKVSTTCKSARTIGNSSNCAMRSPGSMAKLGRAAVPGADQQRALVVGVDQPGAVAQHDAVLVAQPRARQDHARTGAGP